MIDRDKDVVEWAFLHHTLHEGHEHLGKLLEDMRNPDFDEVPFAIQLSHIYAHLNQAWNGRDKKGAWSEADFDAFSQYPSDLQPDGSWPLPLPEAEP